MLTNWNAFFLFLFNQIFKNNLLKKINNIKILNYHIDDQNFTKKSYFLKSNIF